MSHITSAWAHQLGLPDPEPIRADIMAASTRVSDAARHLLDATVAELRNSDSSFATAKSTLMAGWSSSSVQAHVARLHESGDTAASIDRNLSATAARISTAITVAHQRCHAAFAAADASIAADNLLHYPEATWSLGDSIETEALLRIARARVEARRATVVNRLHSALSAERAALCDSVGREAAYLSTAPWGVLPASLAPGRLSGSVQQHQSNLAQLRTDLRSPAGRRHDLAKAVNATLQEIRRAGHEPFLLSYDPDFAEQQGGVMIAIGEVEAADHVSVIVPGITNSPADMTPTATLAMALMGATARQTGPSERSAVVLDFDYDIPLSAPHDITDQSGLRGLSHVIADAMPAVSAVSASRQAPRLAKHLTDLKKRMKPSSTLTPIGFSYGSIMVSTATHLIDEPGVVDSVVLLGSPGAGLEVDDVSDFPAVNPDRIFVAGYSGDIVTSNLVDQLASIAPVAMSANYKLLPWLTYKAINMPGTLVEVSNAMLVPGPEPFGPDPRAAEFGAHVIDTPSNVATTGLADLMAEHSLENYLSGQTLDAVAAVSAGRYDHVPVK